jgi:hypothetical protein
MDVICHAGGWGVGGGGGQGEGPPLVPRPERQGNGQTLCGLFWADQQGLTGCTTDTVLMVSRVSGEVLMLSH